MTPGLSSLRIRRLAVLVSATMFAVIAGCGAEADNGGGPSTDDSAEDAEPRTLKLAHVFPEEDGWHQAAVEIGTCVSERTEGRIEITLFPNSQLGGEQEILEGMSLGTVDMAFLGPGVATQFYAPLGILDQPYTFASYDHANEVMDGPIGQKLYDDMAAETGLRILASGAQGFRYILTKDQPIEKLPDLAGLSIRVPNAPTYINTFEALGANPTPIDFSETYMSIQTGVVDGFEGVPSIIQSAKLYEVGTHVARSKHVLATLQLMISQQVFDELPETDRADLAECAVTGWQDRRDEAAAEGEAIEAELATEGLTFTDPLLDEFERSAVPAVDEWAETNGATEILAEIRASK